LTSQMKCHCLGTIYSLVANMIDLFTITALMGHIDWFDICPDHSISGCKSWGHYRYFIIDLPNKYATN